MIETPRLILRALQPDDDEMMFALDADPEVHRYLGNTPITTIGEARNVIQIIRNQYLENGIGRWAVIEKETGDFMGWAGLKLVTQYDNNHINFYDIGYRLMPKYWYRGYATEAAVAWLEYGFIQLKADYIIGTANVENSRSRRILEKIGLQFIEKYTCRGIPCDWLRITWAEWERQTCNLYQNG